MPRDASLTEFATDESAGDVADESAGDGSTNVDDEQADDGQEDGGAVASASVTARVAFEGEPCTACGTVVGRRWEDDGAFVCVSCKQW